MSLHTYAQTFSSGLKMRIEKAGGNREEATCIATNNCVTVRKRR